MPDNIESPTMRVVFLLHFWRFSFRLGDIGGSFICVNFSCCFWRNLISWISIVFIDLFSISRCCCISSFQCPSLCVWFSVIYVLFLTAILFLFCLKTFFSCCINLDRLSIRIFVNIFTSFVWLPMHIIYDV